MTRLQVLLFAALVLAPLLSLVMRVVKRRLAGEAPRAAGPQAPSVPIPSPPLRVSVPRAGAGPGETPRGRATGTVVASGTTAGRAPSRLGSQWEVRRGIVVMTVLGPCRALEPSGA